MRTFILYALLLTSAVPAFAQMAPPPPYENRHDGRDDRRDLRDDRRDFQQDRRDGNRGEVRDDRRDYREDRRDYERDRRDYQVARQEWRDDRRRYGQGDRYARYRGDAFAYPRGFGYRYYGPGARVPRVYFDSRYYIARPDFYRLPVAYGGTRWLRIGPDALLIRAYDGQVIRVIRGLFY